MKQTISLRVNAVALGCKWRALPERFRNWYTVYMRLDWWSQNGVLERVYVVLAAEGLTGG
jgi:transposase